MSDICTYCHGSGWRDAAHDPVAHEDTPVVPPHLAVPSHSPGFDTEEDRRARFIAEWNALTSQVSTFARKWDMPAPDMIWQPKWFQLISFYSRDVLMPTIIFNGVRHRFGKWEQRETFRSL